MPPSKEPVLFSVTRDNGLIADPHDPQAQLCSVRGKGNEGVSQSAVSAVFSIVPPTGGGGGGGVFLGVGGRGGGGPGGGGGGGGRRGHSFFSFFSFFFFFPPPPPPPPPVFLIPRLVCVLSGGMGNKWVGIISVSCVYWSLLPHALTDPKHLFAHVHTRARLYAHAHGHTQDTEWSRPMPFDAVGTSQQFALTVKESMVSSRSVNIGVCLCACVCSGALAGLLFPLWGCLFCARACLCAFCFRVVVCACLYVCACARVCAFVHARACILCALAPACLRVFVRMPAVRAPLCALCTRVFCACICAFDTSVPVTALTI